MTPGVFSRCRSFWSTFGKVKVMKRHKMGSGRSRHMFSKHASRTHKKNMPGRLPMRGGIRL